MCLVPEGLASVGSLWQPVAPCGNGLDALKTRDMAILEGKFRDMSTGGLEAWRLGGWRPGSWDATIGLWWLSVAVGGWIAIG